MEDKAVKRTTWRRKRSLVESAARARKARHLAVPTEPDLQTLPAVDPEPGPSTSVDPEPPQTSLTEKSSASKSDSENERGESSSDDEAVFGDVQAQEVFDDFMVSLPLLQRKNLSVLLMQSFKSRQGMKALDAAQEAASICGFNERTIRKYCKQFFDNHGKFPDSRQGRHERQSLFNDEALRLKAARWV